MDQYRSRPKLSENFERHWSIPISGEIHMDQSLVHTFSWGNSYGPMVLEVLQKFPPHTGIGPWMAFPSFGGCSPAPQNRNEGTFGCSRYQNRNDGTLGCSESPVANPRTRVHSDVPQYHRPEPGYIRMFPGTNKPDRGHIRQNRPFTKAPFCFLSTLAAVAAWNVETLPLRNVVSATQIPRRDAKLQQECRLGFQHWKCGVTATGRNCNVASRYVRSGPC